MVNKYKKVAVGGTFDKFHKGHKCLLKEAFTYGEEVVIGVTSTKFAGKNAKIDSCSTRMSNLIEFLERSYHNNFHVVRLEDRYGPTISEKEYDAIAVSKETEIGAIEINKIRNERGLPLLDILVIDMVSAEDGRPISSTRIRKGEIDKMGNLVV